MAVDSTVCTYRRPTLIWNFNITIHDPNSWKSVLKHNAENTKISNFWTLEVPPPSPLKLHNIRILKIPKLMSTLATKDLYFD